MHVLNFVIKPNVKISKNKSFSIWLENALLDFILICTVSVTFTPEKYLTK